MKSFVLSQFGEASSHFSVSAGKDDHIETDIYSLETFEKLLIYTNLNKINTLCKINILSTAWLHYDFLLTFRNLKRMKLFIQERRKLEILIERLSKEANHSVSSLGFRILQILSDGSQHLWSRDHSLLFTIINVINWLTMTQEETQLCELNKRRQRFLYRWFDLGNMMHKHWSLRLGNFRGPRSLLYYRQLVPLFQLNLDTEFCMESGSRGTDS